MDKIRWVIFALLLLPVISHSQVRLFEDFSSSSNIRPPNDWESILISGVEGQDNWDFNDPYYVSPLLSTSSGNFATFASFFYSEDGLAEEVALISPIFSCVNDTAVTLMFQDYFYQDSNIGAVQVLLSNNGGVTWEIIYEQDSGESSGIPVLQKIDITALAANKFNLQLKFRAYGNQSIVWIIDDIMVIAGEVTPPEISHTPLVSTCSQGPHEIISNITHPIGISQSFINYKVNGISQSQITMEAINDSTYIGYIPEQMAFGVIDYQIQAVDKSVNKNFSYDTGDSLFYNSFYFGSEQIPTSIEEFESDDLIYTIVNPNFNIIWETTNLSGGFGESNQSIYMNFYDEDEGQTQYMQTHNIELGSIANVIEFDIAYAQYIDENDKLDIKVSNDGGETWSEPIYSKSGKYLATAEPSLPFFIPEANQWRKEVVELTSFSNECIRLSFEATSDFGNNLYLDNIIIKEAPVPDDYYLGQNFPNPAIGTTKIEIGLPLETRGIFNIYNLTGAKIHSESFSTTRGGIFVKDIDLINYPAGIYIYQLVVPGKALAKRMVVIN